MPNAFIDSFEIKLGNGVFNRDRVYESINQCAGRIDQRRQLYFDESKRKAGCKRFKTTAFYKDGITELTIKDYYHKGNAGSILIARCRPASLLYPDEIYALSGNSDYTLFEERFNQVIMMLNRCMEDTPLPFLDGWEVNRIDYAFQYRTEWYNETMRMLRKCALNDINRSIEKGRNKGKDCQRYSNSVYIVKSKCTVNFYDKTDEQRQIDSIHMLRFEVQCMADYLYKMKGEGRIKDLSLRGLCNHDLALSVVGRQIDKVAGTGDFYSVEAARKRIAGAVKLKNCERELLLAMLQNSVKQYVCREAWWDVLGLYLERLKTDSTKPKDRVRRILKRLNMNELAIPLRLRLDYLPNPGNVIKRN